MNESKVKILIVEDNPIIGEDLAAYMNEFGYTTAGIAHNAEEALKFIREHDPVQLILMDVGLDGEIDGIQLTQLIKSKYNIPIIFLTALYDKQTIERIKSVRPEAYLVKPIDEHSLKTTIEIALYNFNHKEFETNDVVEDGLNFGKGDHFFIKVKNGLQKIVFDDVLYFEANDNYSWVYTSDQKQLLSLTLKTIETKLSPKQFIRVHRSFIVNLKMIDRIDEISLFIGEHKIPIGKTYKSEIMKHINLLS